MADDEHPKRDAAKAATADTKHERAGRDGDADRGPSRTSPAQASPEESSGGDAAEPREVLAPGTKVGRYEIIRLIGEGGMGTVYEALDGRLKRKVALKVLATSLKGKRKAAKRFSIEAQAAARLHHPNVVGVFDFDVDCQYPYMAMELLQGETLSAVIARGPLSPTRLADIMLAVCAGVYAAHGAGIVHRDLKPSNIFLCRDWQGTETARVLDFGISKVGGISSSGLTQTGDIVGTSQYISPEQAAGLRNVNEASDQYSLGVVMYECLSQQTPQRDQPIYTLLRNISEGRHDPLSSLYPEVPPALEDIVERAMQVRPKDRFPSIHDLGRALFPFASADVQRRFEDYYGRVGEAASATGNSWQSEPAAKGGRHPTATERLPVEPPPTWQRSPTRTSQRSRAQQGKPDQLAPVFAPYGRARTIVYSIALGTALAIAILVVVGLILRQ
jgi:serine/threonine protein kinase